jgi:hypothetical protein
MITVANFSEELAMEQSDLKSLGGKNVVVASPWLYQAETQEILCNIDCYRDEQHTAVQIAYHEQPISTRLYARSLSVFLLPSCELEEKSLDLVVSVAEKGIFITARVAVVETLQGTTCFKLINSDDKAGQIAGLFEDHVWSNIVLELKGDKGFELQLVFNNRPGFSQGRLQMEAGVQKAAS